MKKLIIILFLLPFAATAQTQVRITENSKIPNTETYQLRYEFYIPVPAAFISLPDKEATLQSFKSVFPSIERIDGSNVVFRISDVFQNTDTEQYIKGYLLYKYNEYKNALDAIHVNEADWLTGETFDGVNWNCEE